MEGVQDKKGREDTEGVVGGIITQGISTGKKRFRALRTLEDIMV